MGIDSDHTHHRPKHYGNCQTTFYIMTSHDPCGIITGGRAHHSYLDPKYTSSFQYNDIINLPAILATPKIKITKTLYLTSMMPRSLPDHYVSTFSVIIKLQAATTFLGNYRTIDLG